MVPHQLPWRLWNPLLALLPDPATSRAQRLRLPSGHPRHSRREHGCYDRAVHHDQLGITCDGTFVPTYFVFFHGLIPALHQRGIIPDFLLCQRLGRILVLPHGMYCDVNPTRAENGILSNIELGCFDVPELRRSDGRLRSWRCGKKKKVGAKKKSPASFFANQRSDCSA